MNRTALSAATWVVAMLTCLTAAMSGYGAGHKGPPVTYADWWDFTYALLVALTLALGGRGANVGIQKVKDKAKKDTNQ